MRAFVSLLSALLIAATAAAEEPLKRLSLEALFEDDALALEQLSGVTWLPDGEQFIYFTSKGRERTLWRASTDGGEAVRLSDWTAVMKELGEQRSTYEKAAMSDPNSSASGRTRPVLSPDGASLVGGHAGDLYLFDLKTGTARFLTGDAEQEIFPAFSPDGSSLGFVKDGDIYRLELATGVVHRVTNRGDNRYELNGVADWVYEEELGVERAYWWSPDGARIAFLQFDERPVGVVPITSDSMPYPELEEQRYPKAGTANPIVRLGIVGRDGGEALWLDTGDGEHYLPRAGWTPNGEVWLQRLNRDQTVLELMVADPSTGAVRTLVTDTDPAWIDLSDDLHFLADGRFVWSSERDGWRHLSLHAADGSQLRRLSSGDWEVEAVVGVDRDEEAVFFTANRDDRRQYNIYRVELATGELRRVGASQHGAHSGTLSPAGTHLVDEWSALDTPPRADLLDREGTLVERVWESGSELEGWDLLPIERVLVTTRDGTELDALLIRPRGFDPEKKYPVLQYVYGGPHSQLTADRWGGSVHHTYRLLADMGMAVFLVDNRGTAGRGHAFETAVFRRLGQLEVADQVDAARWLQSQPWVDPARIGVYGGSYGGYMTLMCLFTAPEVFSAGIAYAPVTDWRLYDSIYTERYMDTPQDNPEGYTQGAPLTHAAKLEGALLLGHGSMDNNVHFQNTLQLIGELGEADKAFELVVYPRTRHGVRRSKFALHFHRLKTDFLARHLLEVPGE
ncbi:MAG TPA: DPP IV N-terminal domain-containing protein [Chondromyces sp.]|nr:DPP IV N-terminal domain-containing protein [Chondromyces sp.]